MMKKFLIILVAIVIVLGGTLMYLNHMNYWPFQGDKIAGVPDGEIKNINADKEGPDDPLSLLLAASGEVDYNIKAKSANVYFDVFKHDKRVIHERITMSGNGDEEIQLNGHLVWAMPGFDIFKPTEIRVRINDGGAISQDRFVIPKEVFEAKNANTAQTQLFDDGEIKKGKQYMLQTWTFNENGAESNDDVFSKEAIKDREQTVMLYVVFK